MEDEVGEIYRFGVHLWKRFGCWVETLETLKEKFLLGVLRSSQIVLAQTIF